MSGAEGPIIILSAPRSFSSVFCAMLGQHVQLYSFPELNLFAADTVRDLLELQAGEAALIGPEAISCTAGLIRAMAELECGGQTAADLIRAQAILLGRLDWPTDRLRAVLAALIAPRIAVEKSPRTASSARHLARLRQAHPDALIIHLVREPFATLESLVRSHGLVRAAPSRHRDIADLIQFYALFWLATQRLIESFAGEMDPSRTCRIRGEDVVTTPLATLAGLVRWLQIDAAPDLLVALLHPERSAYACPAACGLSGDNDLGFLQDPTLRKLRPASSHGVRSLLPPRLREEMEAAGKRLGYDRQDMLSSWVMG